MIFVWIIDLFATKILSLVILIVSEILLLYDSFN